METGFKAPVFKYYIWFTQKNVSCIVVCHQFILFITIRICLCNPRLREVFSLCCLETKHCKWIRLYVNVFKIKIYLHVHSGGAHPLWQLGQFPLPLLQYPLSQLPHLLLHNWPQKPSAQATVKREIHLCQSLQFGLFSVPTSGPQLVYQRPWYVLFCLWKSEYKRSLAAYRNE